MMVMISAEKLVLLLFGCFVSHLLARNQQPRGQHARVCNDETFYIASGSLLKRAEVSKASCPNGYHLARLGSTEAVMHAGYFVFGCLGPSHQVWIESATQPEEGIFYKKGPIKLIAPDAIEKGGIAMLSDAENVRAEPAVELDKSDSRIHVLCQKSTIQIGSLNKANR